MINQNTPELISSIKRKINNIVDNVFRLRYWLTIISLPLQIFSIFYGIYSRSYELLLTGLVIYPILLFIFVVSSSLFLKFKTYMFDKKWFQKIIFKKDEIEFLNSFFDSTYKVYDIIDGDFNLKLIDKISNECATKENLTILLKYFLLEKVEEKEKIINLIKKIYTNKEIINLMYSKKMDSSYEYFYLKTYLENNEEIKFKILNDNNYILEGLSIQETFEYKEITSIIESKKIVSHCLNYISLKEMVKLMFEKKNTLNEESKKLYYLENLYPIWNFFQSNNIRNIVAIKKEIINLVLNLEDVKNIEGFENDFIELAKELDLNKDELLIMKQRINKENKIKNETLNIIHI